MISDQAIFKSVQQCLHLSYLILSEPAREKNAFRLTLIRILESLGTLDDRQSAFLDALIGSPSGTVNFEGLNPLEIRGQAAMIVAAVRQLSPGLRYAIEVHYGRGAIKREAVMWTAKYIKPLLNITNIQAIQYLVAEQSLAKVERDPAKTFKYISDQTEIPIRTLERSAHIIRKTLRRREHEAYDALSPLFERDGLIETAGGASLLPLRAKTLGKFGGLV